MTAAETKRQWLAKNPGYNRKYYLANKERLAAHQREYYQRTKAKRQAWAKTYRERKPEAIRDRRIRRVYGISGAEYAALFRAQDGLCAVCRRPDESQARRASSEQLAIDHDHSTGRVRGLLCTSCNLALGHLKDDPLRIRALLDYIETSNG